MNRSVKLLGIGAMAFVLAGCSHQPAADVMVPVQDESMMVAPTDAMMVETYSVDRTMSAVDFEFSETEIIAQTGDKVRIALTNNGKMPHDIRIDEFGVGTKILQPGESEVIEFVADKPGTYEYYCSVGNHRAQGMVGKLIVQ